MSEQAGSGKATSPEEIAVLAVVFVIMVAALWYVEGAKIEKVIIESCGYALYAAAVLHLPGALSHYRDWLRYDGRIPLWILMQWTGRAWWIVTLPLLIAWAVFLDRRDPARPVRARLFRSRAQKSLDNNTPWKHHDLKGLLWLLAQDSPSALPAARAMRAGHLTETPAQTGPWAQHIETACYYRESGSNESGLRAALARQLGRLIPQPASGTPLPRITAAFALHERALLAVFALFVTDRGPNAEGDALLDDLAHGFREGAYDAQGKPVGACLLSLPGRGIEARLNAILHDERVRPFLESILRHHAFSTTILMRALNTARRKGMLPPSRFLWMKPADRTLWYPLHQLPPPIAGENLRARRVVVEAAGAYNHYKVEFLANDRQETPCLNAAVAGVMEEIAPRQPKDAA